MNQGFYLTLMMGGFNASPVPQAVIDALTDVQVTSTVGSQGGFQLKFTYGRTSALARLHESGFFDPRQRVIIAVTVNGSTEVLMDGIITKQDLTPSSAAGRSELTVTGLDLTALDGLHRPDGHSLSGAAEFPDRRGDPGEICGAGRHSASRSRMRSRLSKILSRVSSSSKAPITSMSRRSDRRPAGCSISIPDRRPARVWPIGGPTSARCSAASSPRSASISTPTPTSTP